MVSGGIEHWMFTDGKYLLPIDNIMSCSFCLVDTQTEVGHKILNNRNYA